MAWITLDAAGIYYETLTSELPVTPIESGMVVEGMTQSFGGRMWEFSFPEYTGAPIALRVVFERVSGSVGGASPESSLAYISDEGLQVRHYVWEVDGGNPDGVESFTADITLANHYESGDGSAFVRFDIDGDFEDLTGTFMLYVEGDEPPPGGQCFWTDLVNATQECGGAPEPEGQTVALIVDSDSPTYDMWMWDGAPAYVPSEPDEPSSRVWLPALRAPVASGEVFLRNTVLVGGTALSYEDFTFDAVNGTFGPTTPLSIPVLDTLGGSGPYSASGFNAAFSEPAYRMPGLYDALPPDKKYPAWADDAPALPRRRVRTLFRTSCDCTFVFGAGVTNVSVYLSPGDWPSVYDGAPPATLQVTSTEPEDEYLDLYYHGIGPWEDEAPTMDLNYAALTLSINPTGQGAVTVGGTLFPEVGVGDPGLIDAYVGDMEFFEIDPDTVAFNDLPPQGTGVAVSARFPVAYHMNSEKWVMLTYAGFSSGGDWFENPNPPPEPAAPGVLVGTLFDAQTDAPLLRVAVLHRSAL